MSLSEKKSERMPTWDRDKEPNGFDDFAGRFEAFAARTTRTVGDCTYNTGSSLIYLVDLVRGFVRAPTTMGRRMRGRTLM